MSAKKLLTFATLAAVTALSSGIVIASGEEKGLSTEKSIPAEKGTSTEKGMPAEKGAPTSKGITQQEAEAIALQEVPGGTVEKAYKETRRGKEVWEVQIKGGDSKKHELYYDAKTGEPVK